MSAYQKGLDVEAGTSGGGGGARALYPGMQESQELRWALILSLQLLLTAAVAAVVVKVRAIPHFITTTNAGLGLYILLLITTTNVMGTSFVLLCRLLVGIVAADSFLGRRYLIGNLIVIFTAVQALLIPVMHGKVDCILKLMQAGANPAVAEGTSPKPPTDRRGPICRRAIAVASQTIMASVASRQSLALVALVIAVFVNGAAAGSDKSLNITNHCRYTVWPGILSGAAASSAAALNGGFELAPGESRAMPVPSGWSGLVWGRTLCSTDAATGKFTCVTGDCGSGKEDCAGGGPAPPVTLGEFTLDVSGGKDLYDVSLVNGFNVPVLVAPQCAAPGGNGSCTPTGCVVDINGACPAELRVKSEAAAGAGVVACKSACQAFGSPQYCCTGEYGNPDTCKPSPYSEFFENACPRAVSYAYDNGAASVFTCDATDTIYAITFCPSASAARTSVKSSASSPNSQPPGNGAPLINRTVPYTGSNQPGATASTPWRIVLLVGVLTLLAAVLGVLAQVLGLINHCFKQNQQEGADTDGEL